MVNVRVIFPRVKWIVKEKHDSGQRRKMVSDFCCEMKLYSSFNQQKQVQPNQNYVY